MADSDVDDFLNQIRAAAQKKILLLPHALRQMAQSTVLISPDEVVQVALHGELIEDYPEDVRGHSALLLGWGDHDRPLHIVCAPKAEYLAIITTYQPSTDRWSPDFRRRL